MEGQRRLTKSRRFSVWTATLNLGLKVSLTRESLTNPIDREAGNSDFAPVPAAAHQSAYPTGRQFSPRRSTR